MNLLSLTDSYKLTHWKQYPADLNKIYAYLESRGGEYPYTVFFGLQYYLKKYLEGEVFDKDDIGEVSLIANSHFGNRFFNVDGWINLYDAYHGALPIKIKAVPEGSVIPTGNVLMTIENTDDRFPWLTTYLESLLMHVWYPCTICTKSRLFKKIILEYAIESGTKSLTKSRLHDFGFRGTTSVEASVIAGMAHLVNFEGTDNFPSLLGINEYYNEDIGKTPVGLSIPAAEHSVIMSYNNELEAYTSIENTYYNNPISVVSDTYSTMNAITELWGKELKDRIKTRKFPLVIRLDSGDPVESVMTSLEKLSEIFGCNINEKGYKVLPDFIRLLQGDGIDIPVIEKIYEEMKKQKWSSDNIVFGSGGAILQKVNRDTQNYAIKASWVSRSGYYIDIHKSPEKDKTKESKAGRLKLLTNKNGFETVNEQNTDKKGEDYLVPVFENGKILYNQKFEEIRKRAKINVRELSNS